MAFLTRLADQGIPDASRVTIDRSIPIVIQGAQEAVRVDTGELRDSIRVMDRGPNYVVIGTDNDHAAVNEFGTSKMPAQPYMGVMADRMQSEFPRIFLEELKRKL